MSDFVERYGRRPQPGDTLEPARLTEEEARELVARFEECYPWIMQPRSGRSSG